MPTSQTPAEVLADAIANTAGAVDGEGAICTGWVLIAEWVTADGEHCLMRLDADAPRWRTVGLLETALAHYKHEMTCHSDG